LTRSNTKMVRSYSPDESRAVCDAAPGDARPGDRSIEHDDQRADVGRTGVEQRQERPGGNRTVRTASRRTIDLRKPYDLRRLTLTLRSSEIETMADIGKFRAIYANDLEEFAYAGDRKHLEADLTNLRRLGLIMEREIPHEGPTPRRLIAL